MKSVLRTAVVVATACLLTAPAWADPVPGPFSGKIEVAYGTYHSGNGGEFLVTTTEGWAGVGSPFRTFCLEVGEYLQIGGSYDVNISTATILTDLVLQPKVAFLYTTFRNDGFGDTGYDSDVDAGLLQNAIWHYMGVSGYEAVANKYTDFVVANFETMWGDRGIGNVRVLNLYNGPPYGYAYPYNQDLLTIIPAPAAALLGLIGLGTLGWVKRRVS